MNVCIYVRMYVRLSACKWVDLHEVGGIGKVEFTITKIAYSVIVNHKHEKTDNNHYHYYYYHHYFHFLPSLLL